MESQSARRFACRLTCAVRVVIATVLMGATIFAPVHAQTPEPSRQFNIPAGTLADALDRFGDQSGLQIVYEPHLVEGKTVPAFISTTDSRAALEKLLLGSGLATKFVNGKTVVLRRAEPQEAKPTASPVSPQSSSAVSPPDVPGIGTVTIVGSRLATTTVAQALPVKVITTEEIEATGRGTVAEVLYTLPEVSFGSLETRFTGGGTAVQLRGLKIGTTLVLLNGRRIGTSGIQAGNGFFDLDNIPIAAVDRIEVLASGSSAVYGGDALAGVVNIVLKQEATGFEAQATYGSAEGTDESSFAIAQGWQWSKGSLSFLASYFSRSPLSGREREIIEDQDHRRFGGLDRRFNTANPGNVFSTTGGNLPGLTSSFAAVPVGSTGVGMSPADFQPTAGTLNLLSFSSYTDFITDTERYGALVHGVYELFPDAELFGELFYSRSEQIGVVAPDSVSGNVPAANPFNPFGETVRVTWRFDEPSIRPADQDFFRPLLGLRGAISDSWSWELAGSTARETAELRSLQPNSAAITAALNATNPQQALNVFQDGLGGSPEFINSLFSPQVQEYRSDYSVVDAFVRGPLFDAGSGPVRSVVGAEFSTDKLDFGNPALPINEERDYYSVFGEVSVPIFGGQSDRGLDIQGAARYDHYSDFGSATSPQFGINWRVGYSLSLRGSYSESFKPPLLVTLYSPRTTSNVSIIDPLRGNEGRQVAGIFGGNPDLESEAGDTTSFGIVYSGGQTPGLEITLTHWEVNLDDGVERPQTQFIVNNETLYPGRVVRSDPTPEDIVAGRPGAIVNVDSTALNLSSIEVAGYDAGIRWRNDTKVGTWSPALSVTNTYRYDVAATPVAPPTDRVGVRDTSGYAPEWKGSIGLGWSKGPWSSSVAARYVDQYKVTTDQTRRLGDLWYMDANVGFNFSKGRRPESARSALSFTLGVVNLLDEELEFSGDFDGFDSTQYDLRGRFIYGRAKFSFQ